MYRTIRINLSKKKREKRVKQVSRTAGRVYSKTVSLIRKTHEKKGFWLSKGSVKKYLRLKGYPLHSQTVQALIEGYYDALKSYFALRKNGDENANPPFRTSKYHSVPFKQSAIKVENGRIRLSLGKGRKPLWFDLPKVPKWYIRKAEICWDKAQRLYYLVLTCESEDEVKTSRHKKTVAIDAGEIHPITFTDGKTTTIYNGRLIRSIKRYREKLKARFQRMLSRCEKYSNRWWKLVKSENKQLQKLNNKIKDARHKMTRHFANGCKKDEVGTVVIGDLTGIRDNIDYSKKSNQKLHQWEFAFFKRLLKYKLLEFGIELVDLDERNTTKTCPNCGKFNSPKGRVYKCTNCGLVAHRDNIGCNNILNKYRGEGVWSKQPSLFPRSWSGWQLPEVEGIRFNFHLSNPVSDDYGVFG